MRVPWLPSWFFSSLALNPHMTPRSGCLCSVVHHLLSLCMHAFIVCVLSHIWLGPHGLQPSRLLPWNFPGKNTGAGCHFLLQGIFLTQGSNPHRLCLLHWQQILYHFATWKPLALWWWCSLAQSCPTLCNPTSFQASLSFTISWSLLKLMSIESVMPSNHLTLCCPPLLLPSVFTALYIPPF